jgi:hypothetical protein
MMIVKARPTMKPLSTGSEMNDATNPSRSSAASTPASPVQIARAALSATYRPLSPRASGMMIAADNTAVADMGPTIRWRELSSSAYKINAGAAT